MAVRLALLVAGVLAGATFASSAQASGVLFAPVRESVTPTSDLVTGAYFSRSMTVEVVLAPSHEAQLHSLMGALYNRSSPLYRHWLTKGRFAARFAPSRAERAGLARYLARSGLVVTLAASPFFVRATGSSARVSAALRTSLRMYKNARGVHYFSNATAVRLPESLTRGVLGVVGLSSTVRPHPSMVLHQSGTERGFGHPSTTTSCETPYPTDAQLFDAVNNGVNFPYGYGGGPGCSGLTPSQTNSIYGAPGFIGSRAQGAGVSFAVFELSAYRQSDAITWARTFYGPHYTPSILDVNVDGGPLTPACPAGDQCPLPPYAGDIEVAADIEQTLSIAPAARHVLVYNAPNDYTGQTELDEYSAMATQNTASVISSSWGLCENDAGAGYAEAENTIFTQMAAQGQSVFNDAGDTGAFDCIRDGTGNALGVQDPASQPWVTSVGGTSLESFNPATDPDPRYPRGVETVWNVDNLCNESASEGGDSGYSWCANTGAGGGGISQFWGRPRYQRGPGVNNSYTQYGNGTTQCSLAATGTPCREVPDISADADEYTPYAEYCTGDASTPGSVCATITGTVPGWFGIGGTSLSTPLWSALIGDRDSFTGHRTGNANPLLYSLSDTPLARLYFHDITGTGQTTNNNGLYHTTPHYDMATGIGSPIMASLILAKSY
ncbi:MAG TPA: S53 family peptidase [Solirubrobacteraceae bacterium]|nr:S53 family peptidase [Solirubrobacteraceae bacterium]